MALVKVSIELIEFIIIKSNYFQNAQKAIALVRERRFPALVRQNGLRPHSSADSKCHFEGSEFKNAFSNVTLLRFSRNLSSSRGVFRV
jgi:hypothetical protein